MEIQRDEHGRRGAFYIEKDGEWVAEMSYIKQGSGAIIIDHTEVDKSLRGQGIGQKLVRAAVDYARANNLKVRARCRYARISLEENPDYSDVLA
jgi:predicted GNAT family acetyltransferase